MFLIITFFVDKKSKWRDNSQVSSKIHSLTRISNRIINMVEVKDIVVVTEVADTMEEEVADTVEGEVVGIMEEAIMAADSQIGNNTVDKVAEEEEVVKGNIPDKEAHSHKKNNPSVNKSVDSEQSANQEMASLVLEFI